MTNDTEESISKIMSDCEEDIKDAVIIETQEEKLKKSLYKFVVDQLAEVEKYDSIIRKSIECLNLRLQSNELSANEILSVISTISNKKSDIIQTLLEPFKTSIILKNPNDDHSDFSRGLKELRPDQLELINKVFAASKEK
jgi:hypothetical protein